MGERIAVFVCGVAFLITMLVVVLLVPNPTPAQLWVFRIIVAVAAAGFAAFLPGALDVQVSTWVKAGGALAVFVIVYFFNPPELVVRRVKVHEGMLGNLYDHLQSEPASDRNFTFTLGEADRDELRRVYVSPEKRGDTWAELFGQVCDAYPCLACSPPASQITTSVRIELKNGAKGLREIGGPVKAYACK